MKGYRPVLRRCHYKVDSAEPMNQDTREFINGHLAIEGHLAYAADLLQAADFAGQLADLQRPGWPENFIELVVSVPRDPSAEVLCEAHWRLATTSILGTSLVDALPEASRAVFLGAVQSAADVFQRKMTFKSEMTFEYVAHRDGLSAHHRMKLAALLC